MNSIPSAWWEKVINKTIITVCTVFNHTPVISLLQVSGQFAFGENLSKWGLGASVRLDQEKQKTKLKYTVKLQNIITLMCTVKLPVLIINVCLYTIDSKKF